MIDLATLLRPKAASALSGPTSGFVDMAYARRTAAGETVTPERALTLSTYFACIRVISEDVAKLPLDVFRRLRPRGKEYLADDPVLRVLDAPNPELTGFTFRETLTQWAAGWGHGEAEIVRDGSGQVVELWPIHPSRITQTRREGKLQYRVAGDMAAPRTPGKRSDVVIIFEARDIFSLRGIGNAEGGYSIASLAAESIGASLAAETYGAAFFGQGSTSSGILTHPGTLSEGAKVALRESWQSTYGGAKNSHKIAVLEEGLTFSPITIPNEQAQFLQTREFGVEEICRWFRVAPHKVQHLKNATFSNIEHQGREHVTDTLMPWLKRWTEEIQRQLIQDTTRFAAFDVRALISGDTNALANFYRTLFGIGVLSPNDIRELEDENPIDSAAGDAYFIPMNLAPLERAFAPAPAPTGPPAVAPRPDLEMSDATEADATEAAARQLQLDAQIEALRPAFVLEADRVLTKEAKAVARATGKPGLSAWSADFFGSQAGYLVSALGPLAAAVADISAHTLGRERAAVDLAAFAAAYCEESRAHLHAHGSLPVDHTPADLAAAVLTLISDAHQ